MRKKSLYGAALALFTALLSPSAVCDVANIAAKVNRVLVVADDRFGGCMAALSVDPATVLPACMPTWVSFSCTGDFTDPVRGYRMLDQAQLALATERLVMVTVVDTSLHNGYCFANRIDVIK